MQQVESNPHRRRPSVTACLVTHNRPHYVRDCLESLRGQTVGTGAFDVIVVDSCGTPETNAALQGLVAGLPNARLLRLDRPGASAARNLGAETSTADYIAYIDDDGFAAPDWIETIQTVAMEREPWPGVIGGKVLPLWEKPLPDWWPESLRGVLSIIEWEGRGEYRTPEVPKGLEPYGVNMVVLREALLKIGGFAERLGRFGGLLLSDEDVQVAWMVQDAGYSARHDSRLLVHHQIQAARLAPEWLLKRLYWQGASTVATRRMLGDARSVWRDLPRRLVVEMLTAPAALLPAHSTKLMAMRWRHAYAQGFTRMALAGEKPKRSLPVRLLRRAFSRDAEPIIPTLDIGARAGAEAQKAPR